MDYLKTYEDIFLNYEEYDTHIYSNIDRYNFVIDEIKKNNYKKIIDISSGRGVLIKILQENFQNINITSTDLKKFHQFNVEFIDLDLTKIDDYKKITNKYDLLLCLDVLEHIELKHINDILNFFTTISDHFCLTVANHSEIINEIEIHLIQKDKIWWNGLLSTNFQIKNQFNMYDDRLLCYILEKK